MLGYFDRQSRFRRQLLSAIHTSILPEVSNHTPPLTSPLLTRSRIWPLFETIEQSVYTSLAGLPVLNGIAPTVESVAESIINMTPLKPSPEEVNLGKVGG